MRSKVQRKAEERQPPLLAEDSVSMDIEDIEKKLKGLYIEAEDGNKEAELAKKIVQRLDSDGDGRVSRAEWEAGRFAQDQDADKWDEVSAAIAALDINIGQFKDVIRYAFTNFDENGDGKISLDEFCLACRTLGVNLSLEQYERIFKVLARGGEYIKPDKSEKSGWESFSQGLDTAWKGQYKSKGFMSAEFVLQEVMSQWRREEHLPLNERVPRALETFWNQAENLSELAEFLLDLVGVGLALGSISEELKCVPDCEEEIDVANLIPLVFLLRKSLSDVFKEIADSVVRDLDQDTAYVFSTVFKPAGMKLSSFLKLQNQGSEWINFPRGTRIPYSEATKSLQLIVRGSMSLLTQGYMAGMSETVAVLKAGSFIGGAQFMGAEDGLVSDRGSNNLVIKEDVLILRWKGNGLINYLSVYDSIRTQFTSVIVKSIAANMSQVTRQSKKFATELPMLFRNFTAGLASGFKADRATIWVHSELKDSLWTWFVSETGKTTYVSIPSTMGLVGVAFAKKADLNIPDCYKDDRFNRDVDKKTGYYTSSMLCIPVFDGQNENVIGVVQLINKVTEDEDDGKVFEPFTELDERRASDVMWTLRFIILQLKNRDGIQDNSRS